MNIETARKIVSSTPMLRDVNRVELLDRGDSTDRKYVLWEGGQPQYILRLSDIEIHECRETDFEMMQRQFERGVQCPEPHLYGVMQDGSSCYVLIGYLQGENAEEVLPLLDEAQQFEIGFDAGQELHRMHEVRHTDSNFDWPNRREDEYRRYVRDVHALGLEFPGQDRAETFVEANLDLLRAAPIRFKHGDYHAGNVIVRDRRFVGVIDFSDLCWGDPVEDFYKTSWRSAPLSVPFARGVVHGYLSGEVPKDFWRRYNLYVAMGIFFSLVWGSNYHSLSPWLDLKRERVQYILDTHNFELGGPPTWFGEKEKL